MSATFGDRLRLTVFGESHAAAIGGVVEGFPEGVKIDQQKLQVHMTRRAPGRSTLTTLRQEADQVQILSGVFEGYTTGTPLSFIVENRDQRSKDYERMRFVLRPGHADYTAYAKYRGFQDYRGGGAFSGRLTAPLHVAGGLAMQMLNQHGIDIVAHALSVGEQRDVSFSEAGMDLSADQQTLRKWKKRFLEMPLPTIREEVSEKMAKVIEEVQRQNDSIGGVAECAIFGVEAGLGGYFFRNVESRLAQLCFSIPAVKGIEFGDGFALASMKGSEANDTMYFSEDFAEGSDTDLSAKLSSVRHRSNHNGGVLGGLTNGMPILFRVAIKPTPSISKRQRTVNLETMKEEELVIEGRHDPCILPRVIPVIESAAALVTADLLLQ